MRCKKGRILGGKTASALGLQDIQGIPPVVNQLFPVKSSRLGHKVLVLANDPMLAALLGGLVEVARFEAAFANAGESAEAALTRVKPLVAIIVDGADAHAENDLLVARARKRAVEVMLFGTRATVDKRRGWAERQHVRTFELPTEVDALHDALQQLREPARNRRASNHTPHIERDQDGTLVLDDGAGTRWTVYDRRSQARRSAHVDRQFVNANGAVLHCDMSEEEAAHMSAADLARQLARATPLEK
jgi:hypothetical protein